MVYLFAILASVCDEEQSGWNDLLQALRSRFGIDDGWRVRVAFPPFQPNRMVLWGTAFPPPCVVCGYDLRATPDRCPECGTVVDKGTKP